METGRAGTRNLAEKAMEMIPISRITVMTGAILLALSGPVRADYQAGVDAFEARDYSQALDELLPIAKQGHVEAQTLLGTLFRTGLVGNQDFITAEMWFLEAAAQDDPSAHYNLGMMYFQNEKMPPGVHDKVEAARAAVDHFHQAASLGHVRAQLYMGHFYAKGKVVERDPVEAYKWYQLAAWNRNSLASTARDQLAANLTPKQMAEAKNRAREWEPMGKKNRARVSAK